MAGFALYDLDDSAVESFLGDQTFGEDIFKDDSINWFRGESTDGHDWLIGRDDDGFNFYHVTSDGSGTTSFEEGTPWEVLQAMGIDSREEFQDELSSAALLDAEMSVVILGVLDTMDEGETTGV